jgi:hypothetical protein
VRDVDDAGPGGDSLDDAVANTDEVVVEAEVGQEGDDHAATLSRCERDGLEEAAEV